MTRRSQRRIPAARITFSADEAHMPVLGEPAPGAVGNFHEYITVLDAPCDRDALRTALREGHGVSLAGEMHEAPLHRQPAIPAAAGFPSPRTSAPATSALAIFSGMTEADVHAVVPALEERA